MTDSLSATANAYLKGFALDFELKYATKIAGRSDSIFSSLYNALGKDNSRLASIKSKRAQTLASIDSITAGQPDTPARTKTLSQVRVNFVKDAVAALKYGNGTGKPAYGASALSELSNELSDAVTDYVTAMGGVKDSADDSFLAAANRAMSDLKGMVTKQTGLLRAENVLFSASIQSAKKALAAVKSAIESTALFVSGASAASPAGAGSLDITV